MKCELNRGLPDHLGVRHGNWRVLMRHEQMQILDYLF